FAVVVEENSVAGIINCERAMNAGPMPWVVNSALSALHNWVLNRAVPARANRLATNEANTLFQVDRAGNVKGGVRTPYVDSPAAVLSGEINEGESFCRLFGTTELFDAATMASLYVDRAGYAEAVSDATDKAVAKGFLLAADGERIKAAAYLQWDQLAD
ncbi:MAG: alpha/beta hydrolase domain-containing protein, partial [Gammaproteobacteria bacterium]|nr:alpha/beta hydrolase domain-containing protein [Gammaproteobacteria bacterium]